LKLYCDADVGGPETNKITMQENINISCNCTAGYMILINNMIVTCESRKQKSVLQSSTKSELMAASDSLLDNEFVYRLFEFLLSLRKEKNFNIFSEMYTDKKNVRRILSLGYLSTQTLYAAIYLVKITEIIKERAITIVHISGKTNPVDILTKQLSISMMMIIREIYMQESNGEISINRDDC
jgi:hypothetical protein